MSWTWWHYLYHLSIMLSVKTCYWQQSYMCFHGDERLGQLFWAPPEMVCVCSAGGEARGGGGAQATGDKNQLAHRAALRCIGTQFQYKRPLFNYRYLIIKIQWNTNVILTQFLPLMLHRKLSKSQLPVQPIAEISSKWRHFRFSIILSALYYGYSKPLTFILKWT